MDRETYQAIVHSAVFRQLMKRKKRFAVTAVVVFIGFYFALPFSIAFFPEFMNSGVFYMITWGWLFAFGQFAMTWLMGIVYYAYSRRCDEIAESIKEEYKSC